MISSISYLINGIIVSVFFYKTYLSIAGKINKNPFAFYFLCASFFYAIDFLISSVIISFAIYCHNNDLLFVADIINRTLFYTAAVFVVQIPLYKYFPKNKKRFIMSYLYGALGAVLILYQLNFMNEPTINNVGIVNWHTSAILGGGMSILWLIPWIATSYIFISDFIKSKFKLVKAFLIGTGWALMCIGGSLQYISTNTSSYVASSIILAIGFLTVLAGTFYKKED